MLCFGREGGGGGRSGNGERWGGGGSLVLLYLEFRDYTNEVGRFKYFRVCRHRVYAFDLHDG